VLASGESFLSGCSPAAVELTALFRVVAGTLSWAWPLELDRAPRSRVAAGQGSWLVAEEEDSGARLGRVFSLWLQSCCRRAHCSLPRGRGNLLGAWPLDSTGIPGGSCLLFTAHRWSPYRKILARTRARRLRSRSDLDSGHRTGASGHGCARHPVSLPGLISLTGLSRRLLSTALSRSLALPAASVFVPGCPAGVELVALFRSVAGALAWALPLALDGFPRRMVSRTEAPWLGTVLVDSEAGWPTVGLLSAVTWNCLMAPLPRGAGALSTPCSRVLSP